MLPSFCFRGAVLSIILLKPIFLRMSNCANKALFYAGLVPKTIIFGKQNFCTILLWSGVVLTVNSTLFSYVAIGGHHKHQLKKSSNNNNSPHPIICNYVARVSHSPCKYFAALPPSSPHKPLSKSPSYFRHKNISTDLSTTYPHCKFPPAVIAVNCCYNLSTVSRP